MTHLNKFRDRGNTGQTITWCRVSASNSFFFTKFVTGIMWPTASLTKMQSKSYTPRNLKQMITTNSYHTTK